MNIAILIQSIAGGGAERQACLLAKTLSENYSVSLICSTLNNANRYNMSILQSSEVRIVELDKTNVLQLTREFYNIFKQQSIDIVFSYLLWGNFWGGLIGLISGVKHRFGGIRSSRLDKNKVLLNRFLQNMFNHLTIYNNHNGRDYYSAKGFNSKRALVIPNAIEIKQSLLRRQENETVNILSVGRFVGVKDYMIALDAFSQLVRKDDKVFYTIVGYGPEEQNIRDKIISLSLSEHVQVVINPPNIGDYYVAADIYFQTSLFEGLSNTVMEAMSYSLPCVVTDVGDNAYLIENEKGGSVISPKDEQSMTNSLLILVKDYPNRIEFGKYNYSKIKSEYSVASFKEKYIDLIESLE